MTDKNVPVTPDPVHPTPPQPTSTAQATQTTPSKPQTPPKTPQKSTPHKTNKWYYVALAAAVVLFVVVKLFS